MYIMEEQDSDEIAEGINELKEKYLYLNIHSKTIQKKIKKLESRAEKLYCDKGATKWSQVLAALTLSSEQIRLEKYSNFNKYKTAVTDYENSKEEMLMTEKSTLRRIMEIKDEILKKRKEIENNKKQEQQLQKEMMLAEKRNNALIIRLGRQLQQAECFYQQAKAEHDNLEAMLLRKPMMLEEHE